MRRTGFVGMASLALVVAGVTLFASNPAFQLAGAGQSTAADFTILLTNDDGVDESGLVALVEAVKPLGRLVVAAPARGQSGTGNTLPDSRQAIAVTSRTDEAGVSWHGIDSTPTACVLLAVTTLMTRPPDLVLSGINPGANLGQSVYNSGTVGATRAAVWLGVPTISFSTLGRGKEHYRTVASFARRLVQQLKSEALIKPGLFLKVSWPRAEPRGLRITRVSEIYYQVSFTPCAGSQPASCFNFRREPASDDDPSTDAGAIAAGFVSVTPMRLDVTAPGPHAALKVLETSWERLLGR